MAWCLILSFCMEGMAVDLRGGDGVQRDFFKWARVHNREPWPLEDRRDFVQRSG